MQRLGLFPAAGKKLKCGFSCCSAETHFVKEMQIVCGAAALSNRASLSYRFIYKLAVFFSLNFGSVCHRAHSYSFIYQYMIVT